MTARCQRCAQASTAGLPTWPGRTGSNRAAGSERGEGFDLEDFSARSWGCGAAERPEAGSGALNRFFPPRARPHAAPRPRPRRRGKSLPGQAQPSGSLPEPRILGVEGVGGVCGVSGIGARVTRPGVRGAQVRGCGGGGGRHPILSTESGSRRSRRGLPAWKARSGPCRSPELRRPSLPQPAMRTPAWLLCALFLALRPAVPASAGTGMAGTARRSRPSLMAAEPAASYSAPRPPGL